MTISEAMDNLVEEVRAIGLGEYFDGLDYDDIIVNALDAYRRDIIARADEILEDMYPGAIDSESDEPVQTEAYQDIDPDSTYGSFPVDEEDWCDYCQMDVKGDESGCCPHCGYLVTDLIEETDYLEEDEE